MTTTGGTRPAGDVEAGPQRSAYERLVANREGAFPEERPAYFSPGVATQDRTGNGVYGHFAQMLLPWEFTTWTEESSVHTKACYIGDWSPLNKVRVSGPQALAFLSWLGMNNLSKFELGQVKHSVQLDANGLVASEGILCRLGVEEFLYTAGSADWLRWQLGTGGWDAVAVDVSPDTFIFGVQGPTSLAVLELAIGESLRDLRFNRSVVVDLCGMSVRVLRTGISGELGYELHGPSAVGSAVWSLLLEAGAGHGIRQLGYRSQSVQHIESGIATNGLDYLPSSIVTPGAPTQFRQRPMMGSYVPSGVADFFRKPGELGWGGRAVGAHDFLGREALAADAAAGGPGRSLVGLVWDHADVAQVLGEGPFATEGPVDSMELPRYQGMSFDQVLMGDVGVGVSSGRSLSISVGETISLSVLDREHTAPGTEVTVVWGRPGTPQREIRATVSTLPFKPDNRRVDVTTL
ncbi:glycine cleavage system aminomethyltransferase T [Promicromonospora sp. AC04]|uniref:glycine cleavage protein T n=1 Tax=Promicromonospora sp. AC04 TaxID=2135723 RepID=UPI000D344BCD|nr:glycine cleavage protein T [Promicromonospora sp. AC04]PUB32311.1 glycine cleavage system aminomethyltransferase T [Promicromonospora sp. AC04]